MTGDRNLTAYKSLTTLAVVGSIALLFLSIGAVLAESWTVSSSTDWWDNTLDNDVRTTVKDGFLRLMGENAVGWWSMDYAGDTSEVTDETSLNNHGTPQNSPTWISGRWDNALSFNSSNNEWVDTPATQPSQGSFSAGCWFRTSSHSSSMGPLLSTMGSDYEGFHAQIYGHWADDAEGDIEFVIRNGSTNNNVRISTDSTYNDGNWHHLVVTRDYGASSPLDIWVDGQDVATTQHADQGTDSIGNKGLEIAYDVNNGTYYDGDLDEAFIVQDLLSENQIKRIASRTKPDSFHSTSVKEGMWTSILKDTGNTLQALDNVEISSTVGSGENLLANLEVDTDDDGIADDNTGWTDVSSTSTWTPSVSDGYRYRQEFKLQTENSTHTPSVSSFTVNTSDSGATPITVSTKPAENIGAIEVDLSGTLENLGGNASVDNVGFFWKKSSNSTWNKVVAETGVSTAPKDFSYLLTGLENNTGYDFRAYGENTTYQNNGATKTFTTELLAPFSDDFADEYGSSDENNISSMENLKSYHNIELKTSWGENVFVSGITQTPSMARLPNDNIILAYANGQGASSSTVEITDDDGQTWTQVTTIDGNHPTVWVNPDNRVLLASQQNDDSTVYFKYSDDNGQTWSGQQSLGYSPARGGEPTLEYWNDNLWLATAGNGSQQVIRTHDYPVSNDNYEVGWSDQIVTAITTEPSGTTWQDEDQSLMVRNGNLVLYWEIENNMPDPTPAEMWWKSSSDGWHWENTYNVPINSNFENAEHILGDFVYEYDVGSSDLREMANGEIWWSYGRNQTAGSRDFDIEIIKSFDGGYTFPSYPENVSSTPNDAEKFSPPNGLNDYPKHNFVQTADDHIIMVWRSDDGTGINDLYRIIRYNDHNKGRIRSDPISSGDNSWGNFNVNDYQGSDPTENITYNILDASDNTMLLSDVHDGDDISSISSSKDIVLEGMFRTDDNYFTPTLKSWGVTTSAVTNQAPTIENLSEPVINRENATLEADIADSGGDDLDWVAFINNSDGSVIENLNSGPYTEGQTFSTTWTGLNSGNTYFWYVEASDNNGAVGTSGTDSFTTSTDNPPTASFTENSPKLVGEDVYFDASGSTDDGTIENYEWDWDDDGTYEGSGVTAYHSWSDNGVYPVTLRVTDDNGQTGTATKDVTINNTNTPPAASLTVESPVVIFENSTIDASGSSDSDGSISSYAFDFTNDGTYDVTGDSDGIVEHSYSDNGTYTVKVRVTDDDGAIDTTTADVTVLLNQYPPEILGVSVSENLIDRDDDGRSSTTTTEIEVQVRDNDSVASIENVILKVRDGSDSMVLSKEMTDSTAISENVENYAYIYDPNDSLENLGGFDVYIEASDIDGDSDNYGWSQDFTVDDLTISTNITALNSNLGLAHGFDAVVEGKVTYSGGTFGENDNIENIWIEGTNLNEKEIQGPILLDNMEGGWENGAMSTTWYVEGNGSWLLSPGAGTTVTASKTKDLTNVRAISIDIKAEGDSIGEHYKLYIGGNQVWSASDPGRWQPKIDTTSYSGSTTVKIYCDAGDANGHVYWDNMQEYSNKYRFEYDISSKPGSTVSLSVTALDEVNSALDGSTTTSFTVNDNRFYRIESYYEETWNLVPDGDFAGKPWEISFRTENYGTENYSLDSQDENFVIHHDVRSVVFRDTSTENLYKRTYLVREPKENIEIVIFQDISHVRPYTLHLNDLTGFYSPPDSAIKIYKVKNNIRRNVIHRFWPATGSFDASLIYTEAYKIELIPESGTGSYYFGLFEAGQLYEQKIDVTWDAVENAFPTRTNVEYPISYSIARENGEIRVSYLDMSDNTNYVTVQIWDKMKENLIFSENVYDDNFNWVYNDISENKAYWVRLSVDHDVYDQLKNNVWSSLGTEIGAVLPSPTSVPFLNLPIPLASIAGFFIVGIVGMLFYRGRGQAGIAMLSIAFTVVGLKIGSEAMGVNLMPINAVAVGALVVLAVLYKLGEGSGR